MPPNAGDTDPGFGIAPSVFDPSELAGVEDALAAGPARRAGQRHLLARPVVAALARDPRLVHIASRFLGGSPVPYTATLFDKSPNSNWLVAWHQDLALPIRARVDREGWGPWSVKAGQLYAIAPAAALEQVVAIRIHLDDSTPENGPLRVLPRTHGLGRLSDERITALSREIDEVICTVNRGGVIAMRPLILHASSKSTGPAPRRVLHVEYAASLHPAPGVELAITGAEAETRSGNRAPAT